MSYTPLFVHSCYSLLESTIKIKNLIKRCKEVNIKSVAITDMHNLFGCMEFCIECNANNIKPIIGAKVNIEGNRHILLYCTNQIGYENLSYLLSHSYLTAPKNHKPEITWALLKKKSEGLIAIAVPSIIAANNHSDIEHCVNQLEGNIEWYIGLEIDNVNNASYMSSLFNTPLVAIYEAYFLYEDDEKVHDILLCIKNKNYVIEEERVKSNPKFKLLTPEEMIEAYKEFPFAIENTNRLANKCCFSLKASPTKFPKFKSNKSESDTLIENANNGLKKRLKQYLISKEKHEIYINRLNFELEIIKKMGFCGYFLIVSDFINFAKNNDIPVGLGRGSGVGSIVAWCIDITEVDPIRFELFFERFLNPGRISMPDFDIDFSPRGREKVIEYVQQKYGAQSVAGIITFGTLSSKSVLKDVGRVMQVPYSKVDNLSKKVQVLFGKSFTLDEMYKKDESFAEEIDNDESLKKVFVIAKRLEGLYRHASAHAAGIVIADFPLYRTVPLYKDFESELPLVQFSMKYAEIAGLVKFDFLGLTALDVVKDTKEFLAQKNIDIDMNTIPLDDKKTYQFLRQGHNKGIFQFETSGMTKLIYDIEADSIEDMIAIVALYRPGPMDNIPMFIKSKQGIEKVEYKYAKVNEILANTYGVMVYQEQILRIAQDVAGFTLAEADLLRRAMGKKIPEEMAMYEKKFLDGAYALNGGSIEDIKGLFNKIERFANYGFNKAHAAAYAIIGYQQAYLKSHYPTEFICASLTLEQHNTDKLAELMLDAKEIGIIIKTPCVNQSVSVFTIISDMNILYSLSAIKNIGEHIANIIIKERENGEYTSLDNLLDRVNLNKREVESLIKSGALNLFEQNRGIIYNLYSSKISNNDDFLFDSNLFLDKKNEWSFNECANYQKEVLGIYLDAHPLDQYKFENFLCKYGSQINLHINSNLQVLALLEEYKKKIDRKNRPYAICKFSDPKGMYEAMLSEQSLLELIEKNIKKILVCDIKILNQRLILNNFAELEHKLNYIQTIHIKTNDDDNIDIMLQDYKALNGEVAVYFHNNGSRLAFMTNNPKQIIEEIQRLQLNWRVEFAN